MKNVSLLLSPVDKLQQYDSESIQISSTSSLKAMVTDKPSHVG